MGGIELPSVVNKQPRNYSSNSERKASQLQQAAEMTAHDISTTGSVSDSSEDSNSAEDDAEDVAELRLGNREQRYGTGAIDLGRNQLDQSRSGLRGDEMV